MRMPSDLPKMTSSGGRIPKGIESEGLTGGVVAISLNLTQKQSITILAYLVPKYSTSSAGDAIGSHRDEHYITFIFNGL
jgi:hypothetical protein